MRLAQCRVLLLLLADSKCYRHEGVSGRNSTTELSARNGGDRRDDHWYNAVLTYVQSEVANRCKWVIFTLISFPFPVLSILYLNINTLQFLFQLAPDYYGNAFLQAFTVLLILWPLQRLSKAPKTQGNALQMQRARLLLLEQLHGLARP